MPSADLLLDFVATVATKKASRTFTAPLLIEFVCRWAAPCRFLLLTPCARLRFAGFDGFCLTLGCGLFTLACQFPAIAFNLPPLLGDACKLALASDGLDIVSGRRRGRRRCCI